MTITIRPEHERLIAEAVETGGYLSPDDVIGRALEVLRSEDAWLVENRSSLDEKIERAFGQFERGEFFSAEESRTDMEERKAAWVRKHPG
ncbi:MAG TPA: hypothetical protein VG273_14845 [Bryobacteraceae bacterium]|jgi:Arc/MetJ-type ribon-helix-helix transcriptional regulator|nr:hypothetical protein [Bryobacteraceae bacterium]